METTQNSKPQGPATPTTQEIEIRCELSDVRIESRSDDPATGRTISGYAAKFDKWSSPIRGWFIEMIAAGAFDECDMTDVIMCFNHNENSILARTVSKTLILEVDVIGLRFSFDAPNTACGNDMVELVGRGDMPMKKTAWSTTNARFCRSPGCLMCRLWSIRHIPTPKCPFATWKNAKRNSCGTKIHHPANPIRTGA